jgi:DNA-directed RNA polymerase subunit beta
LLDENNNEVDITLDDDDQDAHPVQPLLQEEQKEELVDDIEVENKEEEEA